MEPAGKVIFSSLFSQSSNETDEELEVKEIGDTITKIKRAGDELGLQIMDTQMRQNYHEECKALINKQINMEFYARYGYLFMYSFNCDDQALHGFAKFFEKNSREEHEHGMCFEINQDS